MTLEEVAAAAPQTNTLRVPDWALGCVRRRSITMATGVEDTLTRVFWVQAHGMTGDIRIHPARPQIAADTNLASLDRETLSLLASVEGGVAKTSWAEPVMSWADWIGFQPYDKYPEPGQMRRIGDCMIEFAPSGAYVEDWRFLPSAPGLLAGLQLISETDDYGRSSRAPAASSLPAITPSARSPAATNSLTAPAPRILSAPASIRPLLSLGSSTASPTTWSATAPSGSSTPPPIPGVKDCASRSLATFRSAPIRQPWSKP